jgi:hypothetical protein
MAKGFTISKYMQHWIFVIEFQLSFICPGHVRDMSSDRTNDRNPCGYANLPGHAAKFKYVLKRPQMSMKCPQILLMSTEKCPSEIVLRTEFEDVSCRHCPTCPDISCADRVLDLWGGSEDMSSRGKMKLGIPVEIEINSLLVPLYQIVHFHKT